MAADEAYDDSGRHTIIRIGAWLGGTPLMQSCQSPFAMIMAVSASAQ
jgi:hypothetical protein